MTDIDKQARTITDSRHREIPSHTGRIQSWTKSESAEGQHTHGAVLTQPGDRCREITRRCSHKQIYSEKTDRRTHMQRPQLSMRKS